MKRRRCKQCGKLFMPVGKEVICSVAWPAGTDEGKSRKKKGGI